MLMDIHEIAHWSGSPVCLCALQQHYETISPKTKHKTQLQTARCLVLSGCQTLNLRLTAEDNVLHCASERSLLDSSAASTRFQGKRWNTVTAIQSKKKVKKQTRWWPPTTTSSVRRHSCDCGHCALKTVWPHSVSNCLQHTAALMPRMAMAFTSITRLERVAVFQPSYHVTVP